MYNALRRAATTKFVTFSIRFCLQRGLQVQLFNTYSNLLEGSSKQLCRCLPGEVSDTRFYPKPRWFSTDQVTKSSCISQTVSHLGTNSLSHPAPVFVEFDLYSKLFFQQNNWRQSQYNLCMQTVNHSVLLSNCMLYPPNQHSCYRLMQFFLAVKLNACWNTSCTVGDFA